MQKTIKQWLEELPEPYRSKALKNHAEKPIKYLADTKTSDLGGAISNAFAWGETAEGHDYWMQCCSGSYPDAEEPRTLVVLDQDKLPEPPIPKLKPTVPVDDDFVLDWPKPGPVAKIACPELDLELQENSPSGETWISALLEPLRSKFAEAYKAYKTAKKESGGKYAAYFDNFGFLVDTLKKEGFLPSDYAAHPHHVFCSHNPRYLLGANIMDELSLAAIIGTSSERAAVLNGETYNSGQSVTFTEKHQEPFLQVEGHLMTEGVLKHLSEGLTKNEAVEADALDRTFEKIRQKLDNDNHPIVKIPKPDPVNHPSHYTKGDIECIDALAAATIDLTGMEAVCTANAIKYLWRWKHKNGVEDLKKAKFYIDKLITDLEK